MVGLRNPLGNFFVPIGVGSGLYVLPQRVALATSNEVPEYKHYVVRILCRTCNLSCILKSYFGTFHHLLAHCQDRRHTPRTPAIQSNYHASHTRNARAADDTIHARWHARLWQAPESTLVCWRRVHSRSLCLTLIPCVAASAHCPHHPTHGWPAFWEAETELLHCILSTHAKGCLISLGGVLSLRRPQHRKHSFIVFVEMAVYGLRLEQGAVSHFHSGRVAKSSRPIWRCVNVFHVCCLSLTCV